MNLVLQILLLIFGVFLVIAVLMQHGKSYGLSGTISGGAETFLGKEKGSRLDKVLAKMTTVVGIIFVVLVLGVFVLQKDYKVTNDYFCGVNVSLPSSSSDSGSGSKDTDKDTTAPDTTAPDTTVADTTVADTTVADTTAAE